MLEIALGLDQEYFAILDVGRHVTIAAFEDKFGTIVRGNLDVIRGIDGIRNAHVYVGCWRRLIAAVYGFQRRKRHNADRFPIL